MLSARQIIDSELEHVVGQASQRDAFGARKVTRRPGLWHKNFSRGCNLRNKSQETDVVSSIKRWLSALAIDRSMIGSDGKVRSMTWIVVVFTHSVFE